MKEIRAVCPYCEAERSVRIIHRSETVHIRKDDILIEAEFSVCTECGNEFATLEQMDANLSNAREQYRAHHSIIRPEEIVAIRRKYDISQKAFGKILGIGELTINSYEKGILPSGAHNSLIRLASLPENFVRLYSIHRTELSDLQQRKIDSALSRLQNKTCCYSEDGALAETVFVSAKNDIAYCGKTTASPERMYALIQLLLAYIGISIYKMALLKLLFYCDFSYFRHYGSSITGWRYAHLPYGPVPDDYKDILFFGEQKGRFLVTPDEAQYGEFITLPKEFSLNAIEDEFSPNELDLIKEVADNLGKVPASTLSEYTHEEDGWINTPHAQSISYAYAATLRHGV